MIKNFAPNDLRAFNLNDTSLRVHHGHSSEGEAPRPSQLCIRTRTILARRQHIFNPAALLMLEDMVLSQTLAVDTLFTLDQTLSLELKHEQQPTSSSESPSARSPQPCFIRFVVSYSPPPLAMIADSFLPTSIQYQPGHHTATPRLRHLFLDSTSRIARASHSWPPRAR